MADINQIVTNRIESLKKEQEEAKSQKEMLDDSLENDEELIILNEKLFTAKRNYLAHREALLNEPEARQIVSRLKEINQEIKDLRSILSGELLAYFITTSSLIIEGTDQKNYSISFNAKLKETNQQSLFKG